MKKSKKLKFTELTLEDLAWLMFEKNHIP